MEARGIKAQGFEFPRYTVQPFGPLITRYIEGYFGDPASLHPELASLPYSLDRLDAKPDIERVLREGGVVVCARYVSSNMAYQAAKLPEAEKADFINKHMQLEYGHLGIPREDLLFYLEMPWDMQKTLLEKREKKNGQGRDNHEKNNETLKIINNLYKKMALNLPYAQTIHCAPEGIVRSEENIAAEIWAPQN